MNDQQVIAGPFTYLDESVVPPRAQIGGSTWQADKLRTLAVLSGSSTTQRSARPTPGSVGRMAGLDRDWEARLAEPAADLAIVGTVTWLVADLAAFVTREGDEADPTLIADLVLPDDAKAATWFTRLYASARFAEQLPLPTSLRGVILDGAGAIKYLGEIEANAVICILDRSVADETAGDLVVQMRNSRGEPISIVRDLGWRVPAGVEALAFSVPL